MGSFQYLRLYICPKPGKHPLIKAAFHGIVGLWIFFTFFVLVVSVLEIVVSAVTMICPNKKFPVCKLITNRKQKITLHVLFFKTFNDLFKFLFICKVDEDL